MCLRLTQRAQIGRHLDRLRHSLRLDVKRPQVCGSDIWKKIRSGLSQKSYETSLRQIEDSIDIPELGSGLVVLLVSCWNANLRLTYQNSPQSSQSRSNQNSNLARAILPKLVYKIYQLETLHSTHATWNWSFSKLAIRSSPRYWEVYKNSSFTPWSIARASRIRRRDSCCHHNEILQLSS